MKLKIKKKKRKVEEAFKLLYIVHEKIFSFFVLAWLKGGTRILFRDFESSHKTIN